MIYLIAGRPRSGKTSESVKYHIIPAIKSGRKVITNVPLNIDYIIKIHGPDTEDLVTVVDFNFADFSSGVNTHFFSQPEHYQDEWRNDKGQGPLYVVDEAHFPIPKGKTSDSLKNFFTMHGHYGIDIILMSQQPRQIDLAVLGLVEIVYRTIKNTSLGSDKTYTKKVQDGWRGEVVNTEQRRYDKTVFPYYKSHTQSKKAVLEAAASDIKPLWQHWSFKGSAIMFILFIVIVMSIDVNPLDTEEPEEVSLPSVDQLKPKFSEPSLSDEPTVVSDLSFPSVDSSRPLEPKQKKESNPYHPYHKIDLHISGHSEYGEFGNPSMFIGFAASRNGQVMFSVSSKDLILAGYDVYLLNPCLVHLKFESYDDYITCDTPKTHVLSNGEKLANTN